MARRGTAYSAAASRLTGPAIVLVATQALAQEAPDDPEEDEARTSSLSWVRLEGAESCISAAALASAVEERLHRKVFVSASEADLNVEGTVSPVGEGGFAVTLRLTRRDGEVLGRRDLDTASNECSELDGKIALVVSVMIDPHAALRPAPEPPPPPEPPKPTIVEREKIVLVPAPAPKPEPEREPEPAGPRFEIGAAFMGSLGVQPIAGYGFAPALIVEFPGVLALLAEAGFSGPTPVSDGLGAATVAFMHGGLAVCPLLAHPSRLHVLGCAGWLVGGALVEGEGFDADRSGTAIVTGPWLEGRLTVNVAGPFGVAASLGAFAPITRAEVFYRSGDEAVVLYETFPLVGLADVGVVLVFP
jgi:hypothetical protein